MIIITTSLTQSHRVYRSVFVNSEHMLSGTGVGHLVMSFFYEDDDDDTNLSSSESSLSSLVGVVFKPPFLARGHPDRLRTRKAKHMDHEDGNLSRDRL